LVKANAASTVIQFISKLLLNKSLKRSEKNIESKN